MKSPLTKERGIRIAKRMKEQLKVHGIPVTGVYIFGSLAENKQHQWSDLDIAIVHEPFANLRTEERKKVRSLREDFDVPIDIVCLRTEDLENRYLAMAKEVREHGIEI